MDPTKEVPESMKLEGQNNYILWSYKVKMLLMQENLWRFVLPASSTTSLSEASGTATSSSAVSGTTASITTDKSAPAAAVNPAPTQDDSAQKFWACRVIIATVWDSILLHVIHLTDPTEIWTRLRTLYDVQSPSRRLALKKKLYSLRMLEGKSLDSHLQEINSLVTQLASLGVSVPDEDLVDKVLSSLPKSWSTLKLSNKVGNGHLHSKNYRGHFYMKKVPDRSSHNKKLRRFSI